MEAGFRAAFVIPWAEVTVDGACALPVAALVPGAAFGWTGAPQAIVNPGGPLRLDRRVADVPGPMRGPMRGPRGGSGGGSGGISGRAARRLLAPPDPFAPAVTGAPDPGVPHHLILTDSRASWLCRLAEGPRGWLCIFDVEPPQGRELWIAGLHLPPPAPRAPSLPSGLVAETPVLTVAGLRAAGGLGPGDRIVTRDGGPMPLVRLRVASFGGGRLYAEPGLRPVRLAGGAGDLRVAPGQAVLVSGPACAACFLTPDVLVRAADLIDDRRVAVDLRSRRAVYVIPVLPAPALILAAGRWVAADAAPLRLLTQAEAAILGHATG